MTEKKVDEKPKIVIKASWKDYAVLSGVILFLAFVLVLVPTLASNERISHERYLASITAEERTQIAENERLAKEKAEADAKRAGEDNAKILEIVLTSPVFWVAASFGAGYFWGRGG